MSIQVVFEGAVVWVEGYEMIATGVEWYGPGTPNGTRFGLGHDKPCVRFTGRCTANPRNDSIRGTGFDGGRYGGTEYAKPA